MIKVTFTIWTPVETDSTRISNRIHQIKAVRCLTGDGLKYTKEFCDQVVPYAGGTCTSVTHTRFVRDEYYFEFMEGWVMGEWSEVIRLDAVDVNPQS